MKKIIIIAALALICGTAASQERTAVETVQETEVVADDWKILSDETVDGIRHVTATPSAKVCSKQIDITLEGDVIRKVVFTRGCPGNAIGLAALLEGMTKDEAVRRLAGTPCGKRGTSCPDQLARILQAL